MTARNFCWCWGVLVALGGCSGASAPDSPDRQGRVALYKVRTDPEPTVVPPAPPDPPPDAAASPPPAGAADGAGAGFGGWSSDRAVAAKPPTSAATSVGSAPRDRAADDTGGPPPAGEALAVSADPASAVERYPALHFPPKARVAVPFVVTFRLTEQAEVETVAASTVGARGSRDAVAVDDDALGAAGAMRLAFGGVEGPWPLRAVLSLEDLVPAGADPTPERGVLLPVSGDSPSARWEVVAPALPADRLGRVEVALFHENRFLGRVFRDVRIGDGSTREPGPPLAIGLGMGGSSFDVHLVVKSRIEDGQTIVGFSATTARTTFQSERPDTDRAGRASWLAEQYLALRGAGRALDAAPVEGVDPQALLRGMGLRLWDTWVPRPIQSAICEGVAARYPAPPVVEVYTDDPAFPWELVIVSCPAADGQVVEHGPLALVAQVARWQQDRDAERVALPVLDIPLRGAAVLAPRYEGDRALPGQDRDLAAVGRVVPGPAVARLYREVQDLLRSGPLGILHFAGHGTTTTGPTPSYGIALEDRSIDPVTWSGLVRRKDPGPLVFFNACEVGGVDSESGVVEGWAPELVRAGAGGYIAPLWSVSDTGASTFAETFYARVGASLEAGRPALVLDALTSARKGLAAEEDPTALAYVYYGSPAARISRVTP